MRRPSALLLLSALLVPSLPAQRTATHLSRPSADADTPLGKSLPVTRVSLYKNGVGFFEHTGSVSGNASVTIDFTSGQLNDVLQSLTAVDLNGGRIAGADYNSTTPLEQQLKNLPLALSASPSISEFYSSIRGARVEVRAGAASMTGRLLSIEIGDSVGTHTAGAAESSDSPQKLFLTLVSDAGDVHTIMVTTTTNVRLLDPSLDVSLTKYLQLLDANRSQGLRHLTLTDNGTGIRQLHLSYISEVPVWKSTYRILFTDAAGASSRQSATLQGWSVIDNTTGTDWLNVHLSLIAGSPQSFIQPLSQPIYSHRPEIAIAQEAQLAPQTFESGELRGATGSGLSGIVTDPTGAVVPGSTVVATNTATGARETRFTDGTGRFNMALPAGDYTVEVSKPGFSRTVEQGINVNGQQIANLNVRLSVGAENTTVEVTASGADLQTMNASVGTTADRKARSVPNSYIAAGSGGFMGGRIAAPPPPPPSYEDIAANSFTSNTQNNGFDDFFAYNVTEPVTIHKNESALVPILQAKVTAERVTLVHSNGSSIAQPVRALWITNTSGLTLDRGSFTLIENGSFGGEGLLDPIHPNEKRLLSYAADQAVHVTVEGGGPSVDRVDHITASKGVLVLHKAQIVSTTYTIHNAAPEARTVVLEHPIRPGYTLTSATRPDETTATVDRFRLPTAPGQTLKLEVTAKHRGVATYQLTRSDESQIALILKQGGDDPKLAAALQPILDARRRVADAQTAVDQTNARLKNLRSDEDRQRSNITALANADKGSRDRFVADLNKTEDSINAAQTELATRTAALDAAKADLANRIETLQLDDKF